MTTVTVKTVENRKARLEATKVRMAKRQEAAQLALRKAEEALQKAQERLARAQAKLETARKQAVLLVEKQTQEVHKAEAQLAQAEANPPAKVTTDTGEVRAVNKDAVEVVKRIIGRKRKGVLSPLDGADAQALLSALDKGGSVGDSFTLAIRGRKTAVRFSIEEDGLHFETASVAVCCAA